MTRPDLFEIELLPAAGSRFQPTGFPDIGAATFSRPVEPDGWQDCLLVESAQSMGNHLERTVWDVGAQRPAAVLDGLPWVRVVDSNGGFLSSSRTEAHRLAGAYVKEASYNGQEMREVIRDRLGLMPNVPLAPRHIAKAIFAMDPLCLVHGVFFAEKGNVWPGQPKIQRALTAFIEAIDVRPAVSGGVKRDDVLHKQTDETGGATEGYGFVPFHRTEWTARRIVASFALDHPQIVSYGLSPESTDLLVAIARLEIRSLLDSGLRLRTACDLVARDEQQVAALLPSLDVLTAEVRAGIASCASNLPPEPVVEVTWRGSKKVG